MTGATSNPAREPVSILPPLPEWSTRDDLGGLSPSQVRESLAEHARTAWNMGLNYGLLHAPAIANTNLPELREYLACAAMAGTTVTLSSGAARALHHAMTTGAPLDE